MNNWLYSTGALTLIVAGYAAFELVLGGRRTLSLTSGRPRVLAWGIVLGALALGFYWGWGDVPLFEGIRWLSMATATLLAYGATTRDLDPTVDAPPIFAQLMGG